MSHRLTTPLYNYAQYYFHCGCTACSKSWPLYPSITTTPLPLSSIPVPEHKVCNTFLFL